MCSKTVHSMTGLPASVFGMKDRGGIREAPLPTRDLRSAAIVERSTYTDPHRLAEGMDVVFVNGEAVIADGKFTSAMPGRGAAEGGGRSASRDAANPARDNLSF